MRQKPCFANQRSEFLHQFKSKPYSSRRIRTLTLVVAHGRFDIEETFHRTRPPCDNRTHWAPIFIWFLSQRCLKNSGKRRAWHDYETRGSPLFRKTDGKTDRQTNRQTVEYRRYIQNRQVLGIVLPPATAEIEFVGRPRFCLDIDCDANRAHHRNQSGFQRNVREGTKQHIWRHSRYYTLPWKPCPHVPQQAPSPLCRACWFCSSSPMGCAPANRDA